MKWNLLEMSVTVLSLWDKGVIAEEGTAEQIFTNPQKERTKRVLNACIVVN